MYLCSVCGCCSKPGEPKHVHVIERDVPAGMQYHRVIDGRGHLVQRGFPTPPRKEIAQEVAICGECEGKIKAGSTLRELILLARFKASQPQPLREWPAEARRPKRTGPPRRLPPELAAQASKIRFK